MLIGTRAIPLKRNLFLQNASNEIYVCGDLPEVYGGWFEEELLQMLAGNCGVTSFTEQEMKLQ